MDPQKMLLLALMASLMLTVFGFGLRATFDDLLYLVKRPSLLIRTLFSMYVIMPIAALLLVQALSLDPRVELALICLAISPVPPLLPNKAGKVSEEGGYAIALVATMALLSIIIVPAALQIMARVFNRDVAMSSAAVAATVVKTAIAPLVAGIIVRTMAPGLAKKIGKPLSALGMVVLLIAVAILLVKTWSGIMAFATPPTLLAIAAFVVIGYVAGHIIGGSEPGHEGVLSLASATRHPGLALAIATANFPADRIGGVLLLYLLVGAVVGIPFIKWEKSKAAVDVPEPARPDVSSHGGRLKPL
jgi:bile acid:Na+ symporter, BASS family